MGAGIKKCQGVVAQDAKGFGKTFKRLQVTAGQVETLELFWGMFFFSSRRRHTRWNCDWSSDVCSSDLVPAIVVEGARDYGGRHLIDAVGLRPLTIDGRVQQLHRDPVVERGHLPHELLVLAAEVAGH